jgi:PKD repeat protein
VGVRETFWNIRTELPQLMPPVAGDKDFGQRPLEMKSNGHVTVVGIRSELPAVKGPVRWFEPIAPEKLQPRDLHQAQRLKRLKEQGIDSAPPVAKASCKVEGLRVAFTSDGSQDADGPLAGYFWVFGDGHTSREANPQHTYEKAGTYTTTLMLTDRAGSHARMEVIVDAK